MVSLPQLARETCPAFTRYSKILERPPAAPGPGQELRLQRHRLWLEVAEKCWSQPDSAQEVCTQWSHYADQIILKAWEFSGCQDLPLALFALGKLGAQELNISSDVDLMILAEKSSQPEWDRALRLFNQLLSQVTDLGFCLRTDFDLRPGGQFSALVTSTQHFESHYWGQGETWERLALVRLRPLVGPKELVQHTVDLAQRFTYRRYLDYTLLDDLKHLRTRIHRHLEAHKSHPEKMHLKLDVGGIRDIELFVHSLQVIHGGRNPLLQGHSTDAALSALIRAEILPKSDLEFLRQAYWLLRDLENLSQIKNDRQTHLWDPEMKWARPQWMDASELRQVLLQVDQIVSGLLGQVDNQVVDLPAQLEDQKNWLKQLHFNDHSIHSIWPKLIGKSALAQAKKEQERHELARRQFLKTFVETLDQIQLNRDMGLHLLLDFIGSTRAKGSFFSLLLREPRLIQDLARLFSSSPYLGGIVARRPELIDSFVLRFQESYSADWGQMLEEVAETKLLREIFSATDFLSDLEVIKLVRTLSQTADDLVEVILRRIKQDFPQSQLEILSLGKWGGRELGLRSDLDFVFVVPDQPHPEDYKVARRLISRLTEPHRGGQIYSIDLRLRPSGGSGPLLTPLKELQNHLSGPAEAWRRQSYLRSRFINGQTKWDLRPHCLAQPLKANEIEELKKIREKLLNKDQVGHQVDLKKSPGGLIDIEFAIQISCLKNTVLGTGPGTLQMLEGLENSGHIRPDSFQRLKSIYLRLRRLEQLGQLSTLHSGSCLNLEHESFQQIAQLQKSDPHELWESIQTDLADGFALVKDLDPVYQQL